MSKYTIELRQIKNLRQTIFDFNYRFVDEETKNKLEEMFITHFYFKEIGFETIERFKHYLKMTFSEKLEYYEMLINTSKIEYDILNNYDLKENFSKNTENTVTSNFSQNNIDNITENSKTNNNLNSNFSESQKYSDTPQSSIDLNDNYITNLTENNKNSTNTENGTNEVTRENINSTTGKNINDGSQIENYTLTRKGNIGVMTSTDMLEKHIKYQEKVTNIINKFLEKECNSLFMQIY